MPRWVFPIVLRVLLLCAAFMPLGEALDAMDAKLRVVSSCMQHDPAPDCGDEFASIDATLTSFAQLGAEASAEVPDLIGFLDKPSFHLPVARADLPPRGGAPATPFLGSLQRPPDAA